jgi:AraC-like DNA-binding protein
MNRLSHPNRINTNKEPLVDVFLQIKSESCTELIQYLIHHQISFSLSLQNVSPQTSQSYDVVTPKISPIKDCDILHKDATIQDAYDKYIANGLASLPPSQEAIAAELNISLPTFKARFRALYGKTFYQVYMDKKMEYTAKLLKQGYRATKVSAMVGYGEKSVIKFNKMFQKHFGITPKKYQIQNQKK